LVVCCRNGCPSGKFSNLHRGTLELCQSDHWVTILTKFLLPRLLSLARRPALGRGFVVPNFFHLRMMEVDVVLGILNAAEMFWYPSPYLCPDTILSRSSTSWLCFCSDMHCQLWDLI
jgi:hypothetical protein